MRVAARSEHRIQGRTGPCLGGASPRLGDALPPDNDLPLPPHLLQLLVPCVAARTACCHEIQK